MSEHRQMLRGTTLELDSVIELDGMRAYDTQKKEIRVYDGILMGGYRIPNLNTIDSLYKLPPRLDPDGAYSANCDLTVQAGFYYTDPVTLNAAQALEGSMIVVCAADSVDGDVTQIWTQGGSRQMFFRQRYNGVWTAWVRIVDLVLGNAMYLAIGAQAVDSNKLNGQLAAYYENIIARLGYTPVNKAGDTITGSLGINGVATIGGNASVAGLLTRSGFTVWDSGNDGAGSGLDADLLDGQDGSFYGSRAIGAIIWSSANIAVAGTVKANGSLLTRASFPGLWTFAQASGNLAANDGAWTEGQFSPGNGTTTFRIPDMRGRFVRAWDDARGIDIGRAIGSSQVSQNKTHNHVGTADSAGAHVHDINAWVGAAGSSTRISTTSSPTFSAALTGVISNGAHVHSLTITPDGIFESRPDNIALTACIVV